jgi:hypothetical protein
VSIDGARYLVKRNAFDFPNVALNIGSPLLLTAGQNIIVSAENLNPYGNNADIESWIYGREENV